MSLIVKYYLPARKMGKCKLQIFVDAARVEECPFTVVSPVLGAYQCPEFLAQCLGVAPGDRDALDDRLVDHYEQSVPHDDSLNTIFRASNLDKACKCYLPLTTSSPCPTTTASTPYSAPPIWTRPLLTCTPVSSR
jgi:hypothetical protein